MLRDLIGDVMEILRNAVPKEERTGEEAYKSFSLQMVSLFKMPKWWDLRRKSTDPAMKNSFPCFTCWGDVTSGELPAYLFWSYLTI